MVDALKHLPIDAGRLCEYIACSGPLHLLDGWGYLSRAFDSVAHGDRAAAIHLAYYAELRAAVSLLASEGMGVFNTRHVAVDANSNAMDWAGRPTHKAAWELLTAWADEKGRAETILSAIRVESRSLVDWLMVANVSANVSSTVASDWLSAWSVDLQDFTEDLSLRNEMSYRPSRIRAPEPPPVNVEEEILDPIFRTWEALEPSSDKSGISLDAMLLRRAMEHVFKRGWAYAAVWEDFAGRLEGTASGGLLEYLLEDEPSGAYVFDAAADRATPTRRAGAILARAMLLLRLASASNAHLLWTAGVSKDDLAFWWEAHGRDSGLWGDPSEIDDFADLWANVRRDLDEITDILSEGSGPRTVHEISATIGGLAALTEFTRAPLWLLGLES